jgi:superfamily II DNA/RNA helicase
LREKSHFEDVSAVVMDEFHSFNDPERGIVWEFSLGLLPSHVRLLLLSATVGNAFEFREWMREVHLRKLDLVQSDERKVPLTFHWVGDQLLNEQIETMAEGDEASRYTPALVFCFNREECWTVAEQLKGKSLLAKGQREALLEQIDRHDWSRGAGPKLKQIVQRGVGVHHAGVLPYYKRIVENFFQQKLLAVTVCTETLAAGINLPARSVVLPSLVKGPPDDKKLIDPSSAHQMFGRAGRPQFDTQGHVFALAHEDDVKIQRWREKYDQIPEDTKDAGLRKAKKALKKKMPTRRANQTYWTQAQFEKLRQAPAAKLQSRGQIPWRLLAYMLDASSEVEPIRVLAGKRLMTGKRLEQGLAHLEQMLNTLWRAGYVTLEPPPPKASAADSSERTDDASEYRPREAHPTEHLAQLARLRGVNPLYGIFVSRQLDIADQTERWQAFESLLEMPGSVARYVRVPKHDQLPPGPLATARLDSMLLTLGLATAEELYGRDPDDEEEDRRRRFYDEEPVFILTLAEKLKRLFDHDFPGVTEVRITPVWVAGEVLEFGGDFNKYITSKGLQKQEGIIFRHLLRLILLLSEFMHVPPPETDPVQWAVDLRQTHDALVACCRRVDLTSVDQVLEEELSAEA